MEKNNPFEDDIDEEDEMIYIFEADDFDEDYNDDYNQYDDSYDDYDDDGWGYGRYYDY